MKDIVVVPTHKLGLTHLKENSILCSGFTQKHIYKSAKDFTVELKKLNIPYLTSLPVIYGRREDEWLLVEIGDISTHFFVESFRKEQDLLEIWMNPVNEEQKEWNKRLLNKIYNKY